jgi:very-short-patch-repair endonuclease
MVRRARKLRHAMTDGERLFWSELREFRRLYGLHVRRQAPIGHYVADFAIHERKLIIEVDGEQHFTDEGLKRDKVRDNWLAGCGYRVLRFTTGDVGDNLGGCIEEILAALGLMEDTPTPNPSPQGGGEPACVPPAGDGGPGDGGQ